MPKVAKELTQAQIKNLKPKYDNKPTPYPVGGVAGLYIQITPNNARSWLLKTTYGGRRREIGLGSYPEVSLGKARDAARDAKIMIRKGEDPIQAKRELKKHILQAQLFEKTFTEAFEEFLPIKQSQLTSAKYREQWGDSVATYALPVLGNKAVSEITHTDVSEVLLPIWQEKNPTASKLREKLKAIFDYAIGKEWRTESNPAAKDGKLSMVLHSIPRHSHYNAIQLKDAQKWWTDLSARDGNSALALQWQALTATRTGAVRLATWDEIDTQNMVWTIQPGRESSKILAGEPAKRVPLTHHMLAILEQVESHGNNMLVFPAPRGGAMSDATLGAVMKKIHKTKEKLDGVGYIDAVTKQAAVPHGLRSTFKAWARELTTYEDGISEVALWHKVGSRVQQAYDRTDMLEKRRKMMEDWHNFLTA